MAGKSIDAPWAADYPKNDPQGQRGIKVAVKSVQLGQVWRSDLDGQNYLVTKLYNEVFTQYAMLRPAEKNAPEADTVRVRVAKTTAGATLPGYTFTQDGTF